MQYGECSLTSLYQDPTVVQSRVRRLIGRRRAGLDRYASILSREASQPHDYDPITELLSQLSSGWLVSLSGSYCQSC